MMQDDIFLKHLNVEKETTEPQEQSKVQPQEVQKPMTQNQLTNKQISEVANAIEGNPAAKTISDKIISSFEIMANNGKLTFPDGYQLGNELKSAFYEVQAKGYLGNCSAISIANSLSDMAIQGLSFRKKQCYFIPYSGNLQLQRSYFGDQALAKQTGLLADIGAYVVYDGDEFETDYNESGDLEVKSHHTKFGNQDNDIKGAYAWGITYGGKKTYCIMTIKQIKTAWDQSKDKNSKFQNKFPEEACKRTVIRRYVKNIFNTATNLTEEQEIMINKYNEQLDKEYIDADVEIASATDFRNVSSDLTGTFKVDDDL